MPKLKKRMTNEQEFQIMKLVLDKFLWLGLIIMIYGGYVLVTGATETVFKGLSFMAAGAIILVLFMVLLLREYEVLK